MTTPEEREAAKLWVTSQGVVSEVAEAMLHAGFLAGARWASARRTEWPTDIETIDAIVDGQNVYLLRDLVYQLVRERDEARNPESARLFEVNQ